MSWKIKRRHSQYQSSKTIDIGEKFSPLTQAILVSRDIAEAKEVQHDLKDLLAADLLFGIDRASALLADAVTLQKNILVVGDYDADGATATALSVLALRKMGAQVDFYSTQRFAEGYGLSASLVEKLSNEYEFDLLMTVDLGISSNEGAEVLKQKGYQLIITDHHIPPKQLPEADAIVNPNLPECQFPSKNLPGVGVAFYVMAALRSELEQRQWFQIQQIDKPKMAQFLDLVTLGIVSDVMPFDYNNRIIVKRGIELMKSSHCRPYLASLLKNLHLHPSLLDCQELSFQVIPRLNSLGRMGDMSMGVHWLMSNTRAEAEYTLQVINSINHKRRQIERYAYSEAITAIHQHQLNEQAGIVVFGEWHQGVIGILAGKLKEAYHKVVLVFTATKTEDTGSDSSDTFLKGSGRSIPGINLHQILTDIDQNHPNLLVNFGGHAMAAGLTIDRKNFNAFKQAFLESISTSRSQQNATYWIETDGELKSHQFCLDVVREFRLIPWGVGFPSPRFDGIYEVIWIKQLGTHWQFRVRLDDNRHAECIAFNKANSINLQVGSQVQLVYELRENYYKGSSKLQVLVNHLKVINDVDE